MPQRGGLDIKDMSKGNRLPLGLASDLAKRLEHSLKPSCEKIMICGSIRRDKQIVGDVEMVVMPKEALMKDLFGHVVEMERTMLDNALEQLREMEHLAWRLDDRAGGKKLKRLRHIHTGLMCDLYVVTDRRAWGSHIAVRTGPHRFSIHLMKRARDLGMFFGDGFLLHGHKTSQGHKRNVKCPKGSSCESIIPLENEADVFERLKIQYMYPAERERRYGSGI